MVGTPMNENSNPITPDPSPFRLGVKLKLNWGHF